MEWAAKAMDWALLKRLMQNTFGPEELEQYRAAWEQPGALKGMLMGYRALLRDSTSLLLSTGKVPLLLLWGGKAPEANRSLSGSWNESGSRKNLFIEGEEHWIQHSTPLRVNRYIDRFLQLNP